MSAKPTMCENPCETCAKEGLPLLLTRYALMPSEIGAPRLMGDLNAPELADVPLGKTAHYGLRLLRSGYVYVFDEKRNHWDEYFVTSDGYLTRLPMRGVFKLWQQPATEFHCARNGVAPLAGVITIRNAKHAGKVWIAFSEVEWTDAVLADHRQEAVRKTHMTCITVNEGKVQPQAKSSPLEDLERVLPEFALPKARAQRSFADWCPHTYNDRQGSATGLLQAVEHVRPGGGAAIVALHDPVGLAIEIAALADVRKTTFMDHEAVAKPRFAASAIANLETSIRQQAELQAVAVGEGRAVAVGEGQAGPSLMHAESPFGPARKNLAPVPKHTPASLKQVADDAWKKYTHDRTGKLRFDDVSSKAWLASYNKELAKFDAESIAPLANAHVAWMRHRCLVNHMVASYDSANALSGVAYTTTVFDLMCRTVDKQSSYDLYLSWLRNGEFTERNFVMRAMGLNQDELIDKLKEADAPDLSARAFPSDAVAGAVGAFLDKMPPAAKQRVATLMAGLSGPALKYWSDFSDGKAPSKAAAALAAVSGKQIVRLNITGSHKEFLGAYLRTLRELNPTLKIGNKELKNAIEQQIELLKIKGVHVDGTSKLGWYVLLDQDVAAAAAAGKLRGEALAAELAKAIRTPQDVYRMDLATRGPRLLANGALAGTWISGLLMVANFTKLLSDVDSAMGHGKAEAQAKLWLGLAALCGFVAEQTGTILEKVGEQRLRNMAGRLGAIAPRILVGAGRIAGFVAGVIVGLWDIWKGADEDKKGDTGLSNAYYVSGVSGIVVASTMFAVSMSWIALGIGAWIFLAVVIGVWLMATWYIETKKDNTMHEWLRRSHFGTAPEGEKFRDAKEHIAEHKLALEG